uniref:Uncharacterized protein n=1 Tax=Pithovirus LCDPAC02 TaxID=2506601 RepID=A0A481YQU6_9VIRU|nr:MAG: hypothetical protein LCDPAC02_00330 [Pithovirus LCDPAC02]
MNSKIYIGGYEFEYILNKDYDIKDYKKIYFKFRNWQNIIFNIIKTHNKKNQKLDKYINLINEFDYRIICISFSTLSFSTLKLGYASLSPTYIGIPKFRLLYDCDEYLLEIEYFKKKDKCCYVKIYECIRSKYKYIDRISVDKNVINLKSFSVNYSYMYFNFKRFKFRIIPKDSKLITFCSYGSEYDELEDKYLILNYNNLELIMIDNLLNF